MTTELQTQESEAPTAVANSTSGLPDLGSESGWALAQRRAKALSASTLVPEAYRNNVPNCLIALEMASRMGASPLLVMQNLYVVHGNPGWSAKFLVSTMNHCGRYTSVRYAFGRERQSCYAWVIEKATGERLEGPEVTMEMARAEGWIEKKGSKWKTMPQLMLMYRAATFLVRLYAPELSMGLRTEDELHDMHGHDLGVKQSSLAAVQDALAGKPAQELVDAATGEIVDPAQDFIELIESAADKGAADELLQAAAAQLDPEALERVRTALERAWT